MSSQTESPRCAWGQRHCQWYFDMVEWKQFLAREYQGCGLPNSDQIDSRTLGGELSSRHFHKCTVSGNTNLNTPCPCCTFSKRVHRQYAPWPSVLISDRWSQKNIWLKKRVGSILIFDFRYWCPYFTLLSKKKKRFLQVYICQHHLNKSS